MMGITRAACMYMYICLYYFKVDSICAGSYETSHTFSGSVIPIVMNYVNCSGSEVKLWDCLHFTHSYSGCSHSDDAGVRCQPGAYFNAEFMYNMLDDECAWSTGFTRVKQPEWSIKTSHEWKTE